MGKHTSSVATLSNRPHQRMNSEPSPSRHTLHRSRGGGSTPTPPPPAPGEAAGAGGGAAPPPLGGPLGPAMPGGISAGSDCRSKLSCVLRGLMLHPYLQVDE